MSSLRDVAFAISRRSPIAISGGLLLLLRPARR
jgi:hypothetical protein